MRRLSSSVLLLVLIVPVGAGLVSRDAAPATLQDPPEECDVPAVLPPCSLWASVYPFGPGNEVHIAIDPSDPDHLVAVAKDYSLGSSPHCANGGAWHVGSAYYTTFDGGATWITGRVPANYPNGGGSPTSPLTNMCGSDPVISIGPDGTAYYTILNFHYTGGRKAHIAVARSLDGGITFPESDIRVIHSSGGNDKEWGAVDSQGNMHVVWTDLSSSRILYSRSDATWTFTAPLQLGSVGGGNPAVTVGIGPNDEIYVVWRSSGSILFRKSLDGGATFTPTVTAFTTFPYETGQAPRLPFMPQMAVDKDPSSPNAGRIYVVWPDSRNGGASTYIASSGDQGASWTAAARVDHKPSPASRTAMPHVGVAPGGRVDVAWLDDRIALSTAQTGVMFQAYTTSSYDAGATWAVERLVSEVPLASQWSKHQNGGVFIGDYMGIASSADYAWVVYPGNGVDRLFEGLPDNRFQRADVYVSPVPADPEAPAYAAEATTFAANAWSDLEPDLSPVMAPILD